MIILNKKYQSITSISLVAFFGLFIIGSIPASAAETTSTVCKNNSQFMLIVRNFRAEIIPGIKFELYEQKTDISGLPTVGAKIGGGTVDSTGQYSLNFRPDTDKLYALKIWDKRADIGEFWFFDGIRFKCDYNRYVTKYLPALKIVLRDSQGKLKRNYDFSLYTQQYDADGNPYFESNGLVSNLKTDGGGQATIYVAPYNPYRRGQTGLYAINAKDSAGNNSAVYNIQIPTDRDYTFQYAFSNLTGELRDGRKKLRPDKEVRLYEQVKGENGWELGRLLMKTKTAANGRYRFDYPAGTYALAVLDDFNRESLTWSTVIKSGKSNYKNISVNSTKFSLGDALGEGISKNATLKLYSLANDGSGKNYYRDTAIGDIKLASNKTAYYSLSPGYYLAVYTGKGGREYGRAFKAVSGQLQTVSLSISAKTKVSSEQLFKF
ncbi:MAG: hypothetical protein WC458_02450 [Patescibacteria group bacterium]|jgi:hypothetical protein